MTQSRRHQWSTGLAIAASFLMMACASEQVSSVPSPDSSPTEQTVADSSDTESAATESAEVRMGTFVPAEVDTSGTVKLLMEDGQATIELDDSFATSDRGPDLVVVLHKSADVVGGAEPPAYPLNEGEYTYIAELEAFSGAQTYPVPEDVDVSEYQSVAIWCRKFNATFGAATLQ